MADQGVHARLTLAIAGLAAMATYLDTTILFVAFPGITASFDESSTSTLSWVLNGYTIAFAALLVPAGKLADRLGQRLAFLVGSAVFTVASLACGLAPSATFLIAARIFQGVGAAVLVPASLALVMAAFSRDKLPQVIASGVRLVPCLPRSARRSGRSSSIRSAGDGRSISTSRSAS